MSVLDPIRVELSDYQKDVEIEYPLHPADPTKGFKKIKFGKVFYIEQSAFKDSVAEDFLFLAHDQEVCLRYGPMIKFQKVEKDKTGVKIIATHTWDAAQKLEFQQKLKNQKKTLLHQHWISETDSRIAEVRLYEHLFLSKDPMEVEDWIADMNPNSLVVKSKARIPKFVAEYAKEPKGYKVHQFERLGFFVVDEESTAQKPVFNRTVALKQTYE